MKGKVRVKATGGRLAAFRKAMLHEVFQRVHAGLPHVRILTKIPFAIEAYSINGGFCFCNVVHMTALLGNLQ